MKPPRVLLSILALTCGFSAAGGAAADIPQTTSFARYEAMLKRSPFSVATAVAAPAATPNFANDLYIANAAHSPDGDMVTLASSTDRNFKKYLTAKVPVDGFSISNIEWSDKVGATKVTIGKEGQFATLTFNQALLIQPLQNAPQIQPQFVPGSAPGLQLPTQTVIKAAPIPMLPTPPPHVRGVIQRNPVPVPTQPQRPPATPPPEADEEAE